MADQMDANEAKRILGCDDATLKEYINTGQLRAQSVGGKLRINANDIATLANSVESDEGTIILSEDSEDLSIDLGEVVDDSAATIVGGPESDEGGITFDESDQLEVVDFDSGGSDDIQLDDATGQTEDLSFTESNTAIMTSVDETIVDATASDLQTVDYGDYDDEDEDDRPRASSRRSIHSQRQENPLTAEKPIGVGWPILLGLTAVIIGLVGGPMLIIASVPARGLVNERTGETIYGIEDGHWSALAGKIAGFSVNPEQSEHARIYGPESEYLPMNPTPPWRYLKWRDGAGDGEARLQRQIIRDVDMDPSEGRPTAAHARNDQGETLKTYQVVERKDDQGNVIGVEAQP